MANLFEAAKQYLQNKNIEAPQDEKEIVKLFFGLHLVEKLEYWVMRGEDYIANPVPQKPFERPNSVLAQKDANYRDAFSRMDEEQKKQTKKLLRESVEGILFSTLLLFDQPPAGNWKISIEEKNSKILLTANKDLHEEFYNWIALLNNVE